MLKYKLGVIMSESKKTIEVVAAIICKDDAILATQRGYGELKDGWEFPGGKIEPGESHTIALTREIQEELQVSISVGEFLTTVEYEYDKFYLVMHCYFCTLLENETITLVEHEAAKWLTKETLDSVDWLPTDIAVVGALKEHLS